MAAQTRECGLPIEAVWSPLLQVTPDAWQKNSVLIPSVASPSPMAPSSRHKPWEWGGEGGSISKGRVIHSGWLSDPWPSNGHCLRKQLWNHLGARQKSRISGSTPGLLKETLHSKGPTRWSMCTLRSEKHCYRKCSVTTIQSPAFTQNFIWTNQFLIKIQALFKTRYHNLGQWQRNVHEFTLVFK